MFCLFRNSSKGWLSNLVTADDQVRCWWTQIWTWCMCMLRCWWCYCGLCLEKATLFFSICFCLKNTFFFCLFDATFTFLELEHFYDLWNHLNFRISMSASHCCHFEIGKHMSSTTTCSIFSCFDWPILVLVYALEFALPSSYLFSLQKLRRILFHAVKVFEFITMIHEQRRFITIK